MVADAMAATSPGHNSSIPNGTKDMAPALCDRPSSTTLLSGSRSPHPNWSRDINEKPTPRLGFGLQDILGLSRAEPVLVTENTPKVKLGAGLNDFFRVSEKTSYTHVKPQIPYDKAQPLHDIPWPVNGKQTHPDDDDEDEASSEESDAELSVRAFESDDTFVNASNPPTPESPSPYSTDLKTVKFPPPGAIEILLSDTHGQHGEQHHANISPKPTVASLNQFRVVSVPHQAQPRAIARQQKISTVSGPKKPDHLKEAKLEVIPYSQKPGLLTIPVGGSFSRKTLARTNDEKTSTIQDYASLVATGPSIGDFAKLFLVAPPTIATKVAPGLSPNARKRASLEHKLKPIVGTDGNSNRSVHIYVDMSNIHIGFIDSWKRAHKVPVTQRIKAPKFSFESLERILSRSRTVKERFLAGSVAFPAARRSNWPKHMKDAAAMGYGMKIMERVLKEKTPARSKANSYSSIYDTVYNFATTSAEDSTEDNAPSYIPSRNGEQGVDEGLHVEMLTTIIDHDPGTMVLATGDGAEAEFSQGFKSYAIRAMKRKWKVEVCAWKRTVSSAWSEPEFLSEWGDQFRLVYLDPFLDELVSEST